MSFVDELGDALDALIDATDPIAEVQAIDRLDKIVHQARARVVRHAIAATTYGQVARALGMSRQGVNQAFPNARTGRT